jgi:sn-glycerol 3-phosphate transport system permease protein
VRRRADAVLAWVLLAPALIALGLFIVYPALQSFYLSVHEVDPFTRVAVFVGVDNYRSLFASPDYWGSLRISFVFMVMTVVPSLGLSLAIALGLDANPRARGLFRTIFLAPVAISSAMAAMLWIFLYNPTAGYLNYLLDRLGIPGPNWLGDPQWALLGVAIATVWREIGFNVIFFLAGLTSIPRELREAAVIDGAGRWQRFRHVVLPLISPTFFFVAVVSVINSFQSFGQIHILTAGGPANATGVLVYKLYRDAFENFRTGYASAQAVILFLIILAATAIQFRLAKRRVHYG